MLLMRQGEQRPIWMEKGGRHQQDRDLMEWRKQLAEMIEREGGCCRDELVCYQL